MNEAFGERNQHVVSGSGTCANAEVQQKVSASGAPIILRVGVALSVLGGRAAVGVVRVVASPVAFAVVVVGEVVGVGCVGVFLRVI